MFSAGALYGAWEVGVWKALRERIPVEMVVGASAGAWNAWAIAGGATPEDLAGEWLDPLTAHLLQPGLNARSIIKPDALHAKARELFERYRPKMPFGLTVVEVPRMRACLFRGPEITWRHLAATASIPLGFPPVRIGERDYVDGGLLGALPLWAAEEMGATRAIGINALINPPFRILHSVIAPLRPRQRLKAFLIEPSTPLGSLRDAVVWSPANIKEWIQQGEDDGNRALDRLQCWVYGLPDPPNEG